MKFSSIFNFFKAANSHFELSLGGLNEHTILQSIEKQCFKIQCLPAEHFCLIFCDFYDEMLHHRNFIKN
jgi:hypothetical protein